MLLEKMEFLEKAVRIACEEIQEETEALLEGSNVESSSRSIQSILADLLHSLDHFDLLQLQEEMDEETVIKQPEFEVEEPLKDVRLKSGERIFRIGESVQIVNSKFILTPDDEYFESLNCFGESPFLKKSEIPSGQCGVILKNGKTRDRNRPLYLVELDGGKVFALQSAFKKV